jgi:hypothetical protein
MHGWVAPHANRVRDYGQVVVVVVVVVAALAVVASKEGHDMHNVQVHSTRPLRCRPDQIQTRVELAELVVAPRAVPNDLHPVEAQLNVRRVGSEQLLARLDPDGSVQKSNVTCTEPPPIADVSRGNVDRSNSGGHDCAQVHKDYTPSISISNVVCVLQLPSSPN